MKFLHPQFLWALFALAIPLVIHLFNFRRYKTLYFSDNRFLQKVVKQSKSINRLRQLLILSARMLALALLVMAFAYPYLPGSRSEEEPPRHAHIYIDNSPSMISGPQQGSPLAEARTHAVEIIKALPQSYRIQVLSNNFLGRQQRYYSRAEAVELVDAIEESYAFRSGEEIVNRMVSLQEKEAVERSEVYLLSDFQSTVFERLNEVPASWQLSLLPIQRMLNTSNLSIDSLWFERPVLQPGFEQELHIRLCHSGRDDQRQASLQLYLEGELQGSKNVSVTPNGSEEVVFGLRSEAPGHYSASLKLDAGVPYFDNDFYFSYSVDQPFRVLLTGSNKHRDNFQRLFQDSIYNLDVRPIDRLDYGALAAYDLIIVNEPSQMPGGLLQELARHLAAGRNLLLIPSNSEPGMSNELLQRLSNSSLASEEASGRVAKIHYQDPHFEGVFANEPRRSALPEVPTYFRYRSNKGFPLLSMENGDPLVTRLGIDKGELIVFTTGLEESRLLRHPILVPIMLNAALYSRSAYPLYTLAGQARPMRFPLAAGPDATAALVLSDSSRLIPPQRKLAGAVEIFDLPSEVQPGVYPIKYEDQTLGLLAVNTTAAESDWRFMEASSLARQLGLPEDDILEASAESLSFNISQRYQGTALWKWFVAACLLFLILEIVLIKLWK